MQRRPTTEKKEGRNNEKLKARRTSEAVRVSKKRTLAQGVRSRAKKGRTEGSAEGSKLGDGIQKKYMGQNEDCTTSVAALKLG